MYLGAKRRYINTLPFLSFPLLYYYYYYDHDYDYDYDYDHYWLVGV